MSNRSLLFKLVASTVLVVILVGAMWFGVTAYTASRQNEANDAQRIGQELVIEFLQTRRALKDILLHDLTDPTFYSETKTEYEQKHQRAMTRLHEHIQTLGQQDSQAIRALLSKLKTASDNYQAQFQAMINAYVQRGFNDLGLVGEWRKAVTALEDKFTTIKEDDLQNELLELRRAEKNYLLRGESKYIALVKSQLETLRTKARKDIPNDSAAILALLKSYEDAFEQYQTLNEKIGITKQDGLRGAVMNAAIEIEQTAEQVVAEAMKEKDAAFRFMIFADLIVLLIGCVLAGTLFYFLGRRIVRPLVLMIDSSKSLAEGDLSQPNLHESGDETGRLAHAFNSMSQSLRGLIGESQSMTLEASRACQEIAAASEEQLASLSTTSGSLSELSTTAEEFKATMQEFVDRSKAVQEVATETAQRADQGCELGEESMRKINRSHENAELTGECALNLSEQMQRIGVITTTVNEIAEQTKLLALNASIEAARAGEEGRGFAVVATQVRELANQSKEAAGRIEGVINEAMQSVQKVVQTIQEGKQLSNESRDIVQKVVEAFQKIAFAGQQTEEAMKEINVGARQQERAISELVQGISQIDSASNQLLTTTEQTQSAIVGINNQINRIKTTMGRFQVSENGQTHG